jgi:hypothetical protein
MVRCMMKWIFSSFKAIAVESPGPQEVVCTGVTMVKRFSG